MKGLGRWESQGENNLYVSVVTSTYCLSPLSISGGGDEYFLTVEFGCPDVCRGAEFSWRIDLPVGFFM